MNKRNERDERNKKEMKIVIWIKNKMDGIKFSQHNHTHNITTMMVKETERENYTHYKIKCKLPHKTGCTPSLEFLINSSSSYSPYTSK